MLSLINSKSMGLLATITGYTMCEHMVWLGRPGATGFTIYGATKVLW